MDRSFLWFVKLCLMGIETAIVDGSFNLQSNDLWNLDSLQSNVLWNLDSLLKIPTTKKKFRFQGPRDPMHSFCQQLHQWVEALPEWKGETRSGSGWTIEIWKCWKGLAPPFQKRRAMSTHWYFDFGCRGPTHQDSQPQDLAHLPPQLPVETYAGGIWHKRSYGPDPSSSVLGKFQSKLWWSCSLWSTSGTRSPWQMCPLLHTHWRRCRT